MKTVSKKTFPNYMTESSSIALPYHFSSLPYPHIKKSTHKKTIASKNLKTGVICSAPSAIDYKLIPIKLTQSVCNVIINTNEIITEVEYLGKFVPAFISKDKHGYYANNNDLGLFASGDNLNDALNQFTFLLDHFYNEYKNTSFDKLGKLAKQIKRNFDYLFEESMDEC
jgi:hypothetical protein